MKGEGQDRLMDDMCCVVRKWHGDQAAGDAALGYNSTTYLNARP